MQIGIIGVKFTGKTTLFNVITGAQQPTGQGGVEPHLAVGQVPDPRLDRLTEMFNPKRQVNAVVEWVDIPGFESGGGMGSAREATRFLEHGRRMDALAQVIRCFDGGYGTPDPAGNWGWPICRSWKTVWKNWTRKRPAWARWPARWSRP